MCTGGSLPGRKLNLRTYYARFLSSFVYLAKALAKLTEDKQVFQWASEVEATFQTLREVLSSVLIFPYSQPRQRFVSDAEASNVGFGGVISQVYVGCI